LYDYLFNIKNDEYKIYSNIKNNLLKLTEDKKLTYLSTLKEENIKIYLKYKSIDDYYVKLEREKYEEIDSSFLNKNQTEINQIISKLSPLYKDIYLRYKNYATAPEEYKSDTPFLPSKIKFMV
jgi:hypothetical protein